MESESTRLGHLRECIDRAAQRAGRKRDDIALVAVTKTIPFASVVPYLKAGIRDIGENRVQEALEKYSAHSSQLAVKPIFHLIGPLQANKAKKAVEFFDMVQSLDRWELAEDLNRHAGALHKKLDCLVQVKISEEPRKSGLDPNVLPQFLEKLQGLPHLQIRGLMGIPPLAAQGESARPYFQHLRRLFEGVPSNVSRATFNVLSMGMSSDFEIAIEEGSTMVRIGTALFGARRAVPSAH